MKKAKILSVSIIIKTVHQGLFIPVKLMLMLVALSKISVSALLPMSSIPIEQPTINNPNPYKLNKLGKLANKYNQHNNKNTSENYYANFKMKFKAFQNLF